MLVKAKSDIGKVRETNEDSFICSPPLFVVADGMGGHVAGEIASRMAAETIANYITARAETTTPDGLLAQAISEANSLIFQMAQQNEEYAGMGTTVTAAYMAGNRLHWGHVGDSRLYLIRDGAMRQVTQDHSLVGELLRSGSISAEEALTHPQRNILTRAVGTDEYISVDTGVIDMLPGDKLLLCTDGLTNMVPDGDIYDALTDAGGDEKDRLSALVDRANDGGGFDNITVILVENGDS